MSAMSNYLENKLLDFVFRGQTYVPPQTVYIGLMTAAPTEDGGGTEVSGGGYARAPIACSLNTWAGTQGAGTTSASTGSSGTTSNNTVITFNAPTQNWGTVTHMAAFDALNGGNMLWSAQLIASKQIIAGDPAPSFPTTTLAFQFDD